MAENPCPHAQALLGEAIFGTGGGEAIPDAWKSLLLNDFLDPDTRLAVLRVCTSGRRWVLETSRTANLILNLSSDHQHTTRVFTVIRQRLLERGGLPTKAVLQQDADSPALVGSVPSVLAGAQIVDLQLALQSVLAADASTAFLTSLAASFPQLHTLSTGLLSGNLPPPEQLPQLRQLTVTLNPFSDEHSGICASISAYLPQLTHLTVHTQTPGQPPDWAILLSSPSTTLKHLATNTALTDQLLTLLLSSLPSLQQLEVTVLALEAAQHAEAFWSLLQVTVASEAVEVDQVTKLPRSYHGPLVVKAAHPRRPGSCLLLRVHSTEGVPPATLARLAEFQLLNISESDLRLTIDPPDSEQPALLKTCLQQVAATPAMLQTTSTELWLSGWTCTDQLAQQLTASAALLPGTELCMQATGLGDSMVSALLEHAPCVKKISTHFVQLAQDYSDRECTWCELTVFDDVDAGELTRLPRTPQPLNLLLYSGLARICFEFTTAQVEVGFLETVKKRLQDVRVKVFIPGGGRVTVYLPDAPDDAAQAAMVKAHMELLNTLQVEGGIEKVELDCGYLVAESVAELAGLPGWATEVSFSGTYLSETAQRAYQELVAVLPRNYNTWSGLDLDELGAVNMSLGLWKHRREDKGLRLVLVTEEQVETLKQYLADLGVGDCVTVSAVVEE